MPEPTRQIGRRARLRRLRTHLDADPRGDRARQGRGHRESRQAPARLGGRRRRRRLRLPRPDPGHGGLRLAAQRRGLRQRLGGLLRRGRDLPADRRRRRLLRLPSVKAGAPPVPEQAIEEAKLIRTTIEGEEPTAPATAPSARRRSRERRMSAHPEPVRPSTTGLPGRTPAQIRARHRRPAPGPRPLGRRSFAPASPSSPTGAARSASTARS